MQSGGVILVLLVLSSGSAVAADTRAHEIPPPAQRVQPGSQPEIQVVPHNGSVDVNRPQTPFDCELPIGTNWYGSRARCLAYLCGGENVYNEYVFDADGRRRKNPCYGQSPTEFPPD